MPPTLAPTTFFTQSADPHVISSETASRAHPGERSFTLTARPSSDTLTQKTNHHASNVHHRRRAYSPVTTPKRGLRAGRAAGATWQEGRGVRPARPGSGSMWAHTSVTLTELCKQGVFEGVSVTETSKGAGFRSCL